MVAMNVLFRLVISSSPMVSGGAVTAERSPPVYEGAVSCFYEYVFSFCDAGLE